MRILNSDQPTSYGSEMENYCQANDQSTAASGIPETPNRSKRTIEDRSPNIGMNSLKLERETTDQQWFKSGIQMDGEASTNTRNPHWIGTRETIM